MHLMCRSPRRGKFVRTHTQHSHTTCFDRFPAGTSRVVNPLPYYQPTRSKNRIPQLCAGIISPVCCLQRRQRRRRNESIGNHKNCLSPNEYVLDDSREYNFFIAVPRINCEDVRACRMLEQLTFSTCPLVHRSGHSRTAVRQSDYKLSSAARTPRE